MPDSEYAQSPCESTHRTASAVLAHVGHEGLTPLNAVLGMAGLLLDSPLTQDQRSYVETIRDSGEALLSLFNRALDFSRLESRTMELEEKSFSIAEVVEGVLDTLYPDAREKGIELGYCADLSVPARALGDPGKLRRILTNLIGNAVKFTSCGEILVRCTATTISDKCVLSFSVQDTGVGISPERLAGIFEPFSQADLRSNRRSEGSGLGLAISRKLVELMGGTIDVESVQGAGSTFRFTVTVRAEQKAIMRDLTGRRVAAVAGSHAMSEVLGCYLSIWKADAVIVRSVAELVQQLKSSPADALIIDTNVSDLSSHSLHSFPTSAQRPVPIVLIHPGDVWRESPGLEETQSNVLLLSTPVRPAALFRTLHAALQGQVPRVPDSGNAVWDSTMGTRLPLQILLAEDHPINQRVTQLMLSKLGYDLHIVGTGMDALEAVQLRAYDLVLMDIQMPEMDGLEATRCIRRLRDRVHQPRISAITTNALQSDRDACSAAGMDDFIAKPVRLDALKAVLERCAAAGHAQSTFDPKVVQSFEQNTGDDSQAWRELVAIYANEFATTLQQMQEARANGNLALFRSKSHYLKGSSQMVGANAVAKLCLELEKIRDLSDRTVDTQLQWLQQSLADAQQVSKVYAASPNAPSTRTISPTNKND